jgi:NAD(P)-dependent dehydrogenase (short-subunit alcohol dehydrogenase family)
LIAFHQDQRFVVTGASSGLGRSIALLLNDLGATVVGIGRNRQRLDALREQARRPENMFVETRDLAADISELPDYVTSLRAKYGKLQGLVYSAGVLQYEPLQSLDHTAISQLFAVNYFGPIFFAKGFADRRNNNGKGSAMVFISSLAALTCDRGMIAYSGTKAALAASAKCISRELAPRGIRVLSLMPGIVRTEMEKQAERIGGNSQLSIPLGLGEPEDIAAITAFLLSDKAKWITSQNLVIDGGGFSQ